MDLVTLSAVLAATEENPERVFDALTVCARCLYSDASAVELAAVAEAANALERAALESSRSDSTRADPAVWTALVALVGVMGSMDRASGVHP